MDEEIKNDALWGTTTHTQTVKTTQTQINNVPISGVFHNSFGDVIKMR